MSLENAKWLPALPNGKSKLYLDIPDGHDAIILDKSTRIYFSGVYEEHSEYDGYHNVNTTYSYFSDWILHGTVEEYMPPSNEDWKLQVYGDKTPSGRGMELLWLRRGKGWRE